LGRFPHPAPYFVAITVVAAATVLRGPILGRSLGEDAPLSISALAVAIAAWYGGMKPGLLATVLSLIIGTYLFIERDSIIPRKLSDRVRCVMFLGEGVMISWLFDGMRTARARTEAKHRELEEEVKLRRAIEAELVVANERKDAFVAAVAHELRNPLAPIRNALELLRMGGDDRVAVEQARGIMERQVDQMVRLISDLMDVSRIGQGKLQLHRERVELADVIHSTVEACTPLIEASGHELSVTLPPEPLFLDADPARLIQVFSNLLTNAAKYTERGGQIWLRAERQENCVVVRVSDNGIGIPAESLPSVFEMFVQVEDGAKRRQGGLGIGLALVRRLVKVHGGSVEAKSGGRGKGSEFIVRLPLPVTTATRPATVGTAASETATSETATSETATSETATSETAASG
jgi:signal transduction histidine kinase